MDDGINSAWMCPEALALPLVTGFALLLDKWQQRLLEPASRTRAYEFKKKKTLLILPLSELLQ